MAQCRHVVWINNWTLQLHYNLRVLLGTNKLVSQGWMKRDYSGSQNIYVSWYSFGILLLGLLNISDIIGVLSVQLVSIFEKLDFKFKSFFTEELEIPDYTLIEYMHLFTLNYPLQYSKRFLA